MKIKYNWITLIITAALSLSLGIWRAVVTNNGGEFFLDRSMYCVVIFGLIIISLVVGAVLTVLDRETPQNYEIGKNFFAGFLGLLVSICFITNGILSFMSVSSLSENTNVVFYVLTALLELAAGGVFLAESVSSLVGKNLLKERPMLTAIVPIMFAFRLINLFLDYSKISVQSSEMFDIVAVALAALFMYYHAVMFAGLKKSCVKSLFFFGAPMLCAAFVNGSDVVISAVLAGEFSISDMIMTVSDMLLCLYAIALLVEITRKAGEQYLHKQEAEKELEKSEKPSEAEAFGEASDDSKYVSFEDISSFGKSAPHIRRETIVSESAEAEPKTEKPETAARADALHSRFAVSLEQEKPLGEKTSEEKRMKEEKLSGEAGKIEKAEKTEKAETLHAAVSEQSEDNGEKALGRHESPDRGANMSDVPESSEAKPKRSRSSRKTSYVPSTDGVDMDRINRLLSELENDK